MEIVWYEPIPKSRNLSARFGDKFIEVVLRSGDDNEAVWIGLFDNERQTDPLSTREEAKEALLKWLHLNYPHDKDGPVIFKDVNLQKFEINLEAAQHLQALVATKTKGLRLQVWESLRKRLPVKTEVSGLTTILQKTAGHGVKWAIDIQVPELSSRVWKVYQRIRDGMSAKPNVLWFEFPCNTPVDEVVEATINRLAVEHFTS